MTSFTGRWGLPFPDLDNSESPAGPAEINALAISLDGVAMDDQGILSARPAAGKFGRYWWVKGDSTAANNGVLWRDDGTNWEVVGANTIVDVFANMPAATAVPAGTRFIATDQVTERLSNGMSWIRIGPQAGDLIPTLNTAALTGRLLLGGQSWPGTTGIYADLWALWGAAWPSNLPDLRGRGLVVLGTHTDVATIGENEGSAVANRRPKHPHTVGTESASHTHTDSGHVHETDLYGGNAGSGPGWFGALTDTGSGTETDIPGPVQTGHANLGTESASHTHAVGVSGTAADAPAYFVGNIEVKL